MRKIIFSTLKYLISLTLAGVLLWFVLKDMSIAELWEDMRKANMVYIFYAFLLFLFSNYLRGYRWNLILSPLGYRLSSPKTFIAIMSMYFANLVVPRLGEVTRCGILQKTQNVPVSTSFGSVVAERLLDVLSLFTLILITLAIEFDRLSGFFADFFADKFGSIRSNLPYVILAGIIILGFVLVIYIYFRKNREKISRTPLLKKIRQFIKELAQGFGSILKVKNQFGFWGSTILIWTAYYFMSYVVFFSFPETSQLGFSAGLAVLIMGGLGMSAPVQGGFGAYHFLVSGVLLLYGVQESMGITFATLLHSSQAVFILVFGGISLAIGLAMGKRKSAENASQE